MRIQFILYQGLIVINNKNMAWPTYSYLDQKETLQWKGSGCGSVGRAVASDTWGRRFESSHRQKIINIEHLYTVNCVLKRRK